MSWASIHSALEHLPALTGTFVIREVVGSDRRRFNVHGLLFFTCNALVDAVVAIKGMWCFDSVVVVVTVGALFTSYRYITLVIEEVGRRTY